MDIRWFFFFFLFCFCRCCSVVVGLMASDCRASSASANVGVDGAPLVRLAQDASVPVACRASTEMPLVGVDPSAGVLPVQHATTDELGSRAIAEAFGRAVPAPSRSSEAVSPPHTTSSRSNNSTRREARPATAAELGLVPLAQRRAEQRQRQRHDKSARRGGTCFPSLKFKC